jgi:hypothetical protein
MLAGYRDSPIACYIYPHFLIWTALTSLLAQTSTARRNATSPSCLKLDAVVQRTRQAGSVFKRWQSLSSATWIQSTPSHSTYKTCFNSIVTPTWKSSRVDRFLKFPWAVHFSFIPCLLSVLNILKKQSRTTDRGWSSSSVKRRGVNKFPP